MIEEMRKEGMFLPNGNFNPSYAKKFLNSMTEERKQWYDNSPGATLSEKVYLEIKQVNPPKCKCGNPLKFISYGEGYREYCSLKCKCEGTASKIAETNIKKYGGKTPASSKAVRDKMKATTKERFGVDNIFEDSDRIKKAFNDKYGVDHAIAIPGVKEKIKKTNMERYGVEYVAQAPEIVEKRSRTNKEKYGNICSLHGKEIQDQIRKDRMENYWRVLTNSERLKGLVEPMFPISEYTGNLDEENQTIYYPWRCKKCNTVFEDYIANGRVPRCPECYPPKIQGTMKKELVDWLKGILPNGNFKLNDRRTISPLELDIYLPDHSLAIEFDEIYWHSERVTPSRDRFYHLNKTEQCKKLGITLIHVYDAEWFNTPDIIKSIILGKLGIYDQVIGARKGTVVEVSAEESKAFLDANHIQGYAPATIRFGLIIEGRLVAHLCLGKNRFKPDTYEVVRYATLLNYQVQGSLSKLWKKARTCLPEHFTLVSYVDRRFFTGESNKHLGLKLTGVNKPGFYYTKDYKNLHNRMAFQKHRISKKLPVYDPDLTEWENMQLNGYDRIWDCGTYVYSNEF